MILLSEYILALVAILGFLASVVALIRKIMKWRDGVRAFSARMLSAVSIVERELNPNGGGSIRDMVSRIDERLTRTEAWSRNLAQSLDLACWESSLDGSCTWVSRSLCHLSGRTAEEIMGNAWMNIIHPEDVTSVVREWNASVAQGREFKMCYRLVKPDGSAVPVSGEAYVMRDASGNAIGFVGTVRQTGLKACPSVDRCEKVGR